MTPRGRRPDEGRLIAEGRGASIRTKAGWVALAALLLWVPVTLGLEFPPRSDELGFHIPNVQRFADHFPSLDEMRSTDLAMLPFFHGILGGLARWTGTSVPALRGWMLAIGLAGVAVFALGARRLLGGWALPACLALAAFPYFGATYFTVMTDTPAFLLLVVSWLAQAQCLERGRTRDYLGAGLAGLLLVLVRQNLIVAHGIFLVVVLFRAVRDARDARDVRGGARGGIRPPPLAWAALALPFLGLVFEVLLWGGLLPPATRRWPGWYDARPLTHLLGIVSIAANVGYYGIPAALCLWIERARALASRRTLLVAILCAAATVLGGWLRGPAYVSTYGTYRHVLQLVSSEAGMAAAGTIVFLSLLSFATMAMGAWGWAFGPEGRARPARWLPVGLLGIGPVVFSYGIFRIFERHTLPVFASAVIAWLGGFPLETSWRRRGFALAVLFAAAHGVAYALGVHRGGIELPYGSR